MRRLPEKFTIGFVESHQVPTVTRQFGIFERFIICSDKNFSTNNEWSRVALGSKFGYPFDIFAAFQIPTFGNTCFVGDHVTAQRASPQRNFFFRRRGGYRKNEKHCQFYDVDKS